MSVGGVEEGPGPQSEPSGLVLVNGPAGSVQGPRARALFGGSARVVYKDRGRVGSVPVFREALRAQRSGFVYCIDLGIPAAPLAALRRRSRPRVQLVYEIGDPAKPLLAGQKRPAWEVALAHAMDRRLPLVADRLVFRGSYLAEYFATVVPGGKLPPWLWVPDGADLDVFAPRRDDPAVLDLRRRHGLEGQFVVGLVGNLHHDPVNNLFYGWELAESLALIPRDLPIVGVVVGDGPGRPVLEATRDRLGLGDRLKLVGRVPHDEVPAWMNVFDVGLSTQTDNPVGWGRTTAKLPEYLACGLAVVCTDVGEAHRWLGSSGQTLPYRGMRDDSYPPRLASRLGELAVADLGPLRKHNRALAERVFDYKILRRQVAAFLAGEEVAEAMPGERLAVS
jgi:glycosyltransferase involved in cell wall biosynthesis